MRWELAKGALVDEDTKVEFGLSRTVYENEPPSAHQLDIYCSEDDEPQYYLREQGVFKLASIRLNFDGVSSKVIVQFGHRRGVLMFTCYAGGQEIGNAEITFDGQSTTDVAEALGDLDIGDTGAYAPGCGVQ
ncbi:hypothetical protein CKM354_000154400 [Cercospora kikuchii]|uniref:Uncharacterized protein n=1 Tax=Cercospora kikuchii TaxID=84275 RepID=A0A9P3CAV5_9PEZI|nr:uncharacterized protein CKM354_000154400 [Cercospora kikuchii]GIZ38121.1 hypothetical protein CKM354_000154400 [Cercospora kikuchii]